MLYLTRLANVFLFVFKLLGKGVLFCLVTLMVVIQLVLSFLALPIVFLLQLVEFITVPFTYYMITGKNYYDKYLPIKYVFCDFIYDKKINFHKDKITFPFENDYYSNLYDKIRKIDPKSNLKIEKNV